MIDTSKIAKRWQELSGEIVTGMAEWRQQHPKATLREIEAALDERMGRLRAKMLEEAAMLSEAREWKGEGNAPLCPDCGVPLAARTVWDTRDANAWGRDDAVETGLWGLPAVWARLFSPWMKSWN